MSDTTATGLKNAELEPFFELSERVGEAIFWTGTIGEDEEVLSSFDPAKRYTLRVSRRSSEYVRVPQEVVYTHTLECGHCGPVEHELTRIEPSRIEWCGGVKRGDYAFYFTFPSRLHALENDASASAMENVR